MATPSTNRGDIQPRILRFMAALGLHVLETADADPEAAPAILSGAGAPAMVAPLGSIYLRDDGDAVTSVYQNVDGSTGWIALAAGPTVVADPGDAAAIPVIMPWGSLAITTAGAETNTLADPAYAGQKLVIVCDVYVGNRVVTAASKVNVAANTIMTFGAAGEFVALEAVQEAGALRWQIVGNDGVGLS